MNVSRVIASIEIDTEGDLLRAFVGTIRVLQESCIKWWQSAVRIFGRQCEVIATRRVASACALLLLIRLHRDHEHPCPRGCERRPHLVEPTRTCSSPCARIVVARSLGRVRAPAGRLLARLAKQKDQPGLPRRGALSPVARRRAGGVTSAYSNHRVLRDLCTCVGHPRRHEPPCARRDACAQRRAGRARRRGRGFSGHRRVRAPPVDRDGAHPHSRALCSPGARRERARRPSRTDRRAGAPPG